MPELHRAIDNCVVCDQLVNPLNKPQAGLDRGNGNEIFIVGRSPGTGYENGTSEWDLLESRIPRSQTIGRRVHVMDRSRTLYC